MGRNSTERVVTGSQPAVTTPRTRVVDLYCMMEAGDYDIACNRIIVSGDTFEIFFDKGGNRQSETISDKEGTMPGKAYRYDLHAIDVLFPINCDGCRTIKVRLRVNIYNVEERREVHITFYDDLCRGVVSVYKEESAEVIDRGLEDSTIKKTKELMRLCEASVCFDTKDLMTLLKKCGFIPTDDRPQPFVRTYRDPCVEDRVFTVIEYQTSKLRDPILKYFVWLQDSKQQERNK